ncbi:hypothetical protein C8Q80DRAFT_1119937 [Daedaleopsis nitida]|nr:hypothetical protein C8Q80DRAFT_1119937 [Daedaleopsis nitida]
MDPNDLSSLSEVESLSDSDWLDISSRASEDNDSFADSDVSDREDLASDYRHIEDGTDNSDAPPPLSRGDHTLQLSQQSSSFRTVALSEAAVARHIALEDPEEERRVKDALDQSMISTLSASRSNSLNASSQTSIVRDLRLSFPDPLTSSSPPARSLSPSYEDITADMAQSTPDTQARTEMVAEATLTAADPGAIPMPVVAPDNAAVSTEVLSNVAIDFYIVLYGSSSAIKHRVVHRVLEKLMAATQCGFSSLPQTYVPQNIRMLISGGRATHCIISIVDRTESALCGKESNQLALSDRPSLAVVFLPALISSVPEHTLYLPVLTQDELEDDEDTLSPIDRLLDAEHQWDSMLVPKSKLVSAAFTSSRSAVIEEEEIDSVPPARVARAFRPLLPWTEQWASRHLASRNAITLFAILSIVLGYLVNGSLPIPTSRRATPTVDMIARAVPSPVANASLPAPTTTPSSVGLISSSLKDFALAAFSPYAIASTSSVATKAVPSPTAAPIEGPEPETMSAPSECSCGCGLITWPEKFRPTTELMLRPMPATPSLPNKAYHKVDSLAVVASSPPPVSVSVSDKGKGKARAMEDDSLYALSTRIAGALSEYLDVRTMFAQTIHDVQEILDALDALARAIGRQTETVVAQGRTAVAVVRENIRSRHERARTRAKELREVGQRLFSSVSAQVRGRVSIAKENARVAREKVHIGREDSFRVRKEKRRERREQRRAERRMRRALSVEV